MSLDLYKRIQDDGKEEVKKQFVGVIWILPVCGIKVKIFETIIKETIEIKRPLNEVVSICLMAARALSGRE